MIDWYQVRDVMTTKVKNLINRLEEVRREKGLPKSKFGPDELGVAWVTYRKWTYGENKPDADNLLKIQEYIEDYEKSN